MRIATYNIENLDDASVDPDKDAPFDVRLKVLRPMLERLHADIICFQEVHGQDVDNGPRDLRALKTLLSGTRYAGHTLSSTTLKNRPDVERYRNLVVATPPGYVVEEVREIRNTLVNPPQYSQVTADGDQVAKDVIWERPTLYVRVKLPSGVVLHILNVHFKSKNPTRIDGQALTNYKWKTSAGWAEGYFLSSMKRVGAALETRIFIDGIFDQDEEANILICGDFNAEPHEVPVMAIRGMTEDTGNPELNPRVMHPVVLSIADSRRFSLYHHGKGNLLDHMLVSRRMMACYRGSEIHNETVHDESIAYAFDSKFPESDHAPVIAEFDLDVLQVPVDT